MSAVVPTHIFAATLRSIFPTRNGALSKTPRDCFRSSTESFSTQTGTIIQRTIRHYKPLINQVTKQLRSAHIGATGAEMRRGRRPTQSEAEWSYQAMATFTYGMGAHGNARAAHRAIRACLTLEATAFECTKPFNARHLRRRPWVSSLV